MMAEPHITLQAYHVSSGSNLPVHRVVIHATAPGIGFPRASANGEARATAHYFQSSGSGGSAHYIEDARDEEHCVADNRIAWHAPPNQGSVGIELCAEASYSRAQWLSKEVAPILNKGAARTAELCLRFGLPIVKLSVADLLHGKRGICGHVDVSHAWHQSDHTDPGPHFPWDEFIKMVEAWAKLAHHPSPTPAPAPHPAPTSVPKFPGRLLTLGVHGSDVHEWQTGANHYHKAGLTVDGQYGPHSVAACKHLQAQKHLSQDGKVGPQTWAATFKS